MKKLILLLFVCLAVTGFSQSIMKIHHKDGNVTQIPTANIERIVFDDGVPVSTGNTVTDIEGNVYPVVKIGEQYWMAENLRVTKYRDGSAIRNVRNLNEWKELETPAYCWYDNNVSNKNEYGALYNFNAVETNRLCPDGWHVPTRSEWEQLFDFLGGRSQAGGKMKQVGTALWYPPNGGATNESGFNAKPAGHLHMDTFRNMGTGASWWSSDRMVYYLNNTNANVSGTIHAGQTLKNGYSVRCIRD